jgi:hypothetical protein
MGNSQLYFLYSSCPLSSSPSQIASDKARWKEPPMRFEEAWRERTCGFKERELRFVVGNLA